jgi:hypothetical protein
VKDTKTAPTTKTKIVTKPTNWAKMIVKPIVRIFSFIVANPTPTREL